MINWYLIYAYALGFAFILSVALTALIRRLALRWNALDHPGERKMQSAPVPLLGGVAIFVAFNLIIVSNLILLEPVRRFGFDWLELHVFSFLGADVYWKLAGLVAGGCVIFVLGLIDDLKVLTPEIKLLGQVLAAFIVVASGIRLNLFLPELFDGGWVVTVLTSALTMLWLVTIVNAFNFLDNMDGLSAGVSAISGFAIFLCVMPQNTFVGVQLAVFIGAVSGFLFHNVNPARIYMGDAGSMFCGYILAVSAVLATFFDEGTPSRVAILAPVVALSVPIFDMVTVVYIRWRNGESIMKGDKRHFSHRLVDMGMTPHQAVDFIFLVGAMAGIAAIILRLVDRWGSILVLAQVVGLYGLIVILMHAGAPRNKGSDG